MEEESSCGVVVELCVGDCVVRLRAQLAERYEEVCVDVESGEHSKTVHLSTFAEHRVPRNLKDKSIEVAIAVEND